MLAKLNGNNHLVLLSFGKMKFVGKENIATDIFKPQWTICRSTDEINFQNLFSEKRLLSDFSSSNAILG